MNRLFEKKVFKMISILEVSQNIGIFNSYFIDEIKNIEVANVWEKSRSVVQVYNDHNKMSTFTQLYSI